MRIIVPQSSQGEFVTENGENCEEIPDVTGLNILLGANNSRKSRLMRSILSQEKIYYYNSGSDKINLRVVQMTIERIMKCFGEFSGLGSGFSLSLQSKKFPLNWKSHSIDLLERLERVQENREHVDVFGKMTRDNLTNLSRILTRYFDDPEAISQDDHDHLSIISNLLIVYGRGDELTKLLRTYALNVPRLVAQPHVEPSWAELLQECVNLGVIIEYLLFNYKVYRGARVYIPIMRGANSLVNGARIKDDIYENSVRSNYKIVGKQYIDVYTGFKFYDILVALMQSKDFERKQLKEFEQFLSVTFFAGKKVEITPFRGKEPSDMHVNVLVEGNRECDLHDLGDGIQALIVLLFPIFTAKNGAFLFIEEPETNLHPGFQRVFIETILRNEFVRSKELKIFITTHSNHMVNVSGLDQDRVSYFLFKWIDENKSQISSVSSRDSEILKQLGVSNSSVFMAKSSIWVEGLTDRLYLRNYLQAFFKAHPHKTKLIEDLDFSFVEYGGSSLAHYEFLDEQSSIEGSELISALAISSRIVLISDLDGPRKQTKHKTYKSLKQDNFLYLVTSGYEIENMLSPELILKAFNRSFKNFEPKRIGDFLEDYSAYSRSADQKPIGLFVKEAYQAKLKPYLEENGTLTTYAKRKVCMSLNDDISWEEMSSNARELTEEIVKFISAST